MKPEIILVSHGRLALGMLDSLHLIVGETDNLTAYAAYVSGDETDYVQEITQRVTAAPQTQFIILTDILGGSVNTNLTQLLRQFTNVYLITGMNLSLALQFMTINGQVDEASITALIKQSRQGLLSVNALMADQLRKGEN